MSIHTSRSGGPERKRGKRLVREADKRRLPSSANSSNHSRKRFRQAEASIQEQGIGQHNLSPRRQKTAESNPTRGEMQDQGEPRQSRGRGSQTLQQEEAKIRAVVYTPESSEAGTGAEERTIKPSKSTPRKRTATTPGNGRKCG
ncbi:hypothetical protein TNIN_30651 [Trichonephila inaurata madagascariensis]|uniref:Uncharacterized protein n=1 Tax=Trichonephila inaurata madagascariensis TaxID=2747483 RepID=A0A8X6XC04_9ARAC|nr:hypothetical protein TNIN_30651 [Trichonephila inaurata madagascariensis]